MKEISLEKENIEFKVEIKDLWEKFLSQNGCCELTGIPLELRRYKNCYKSQYLASLDRINPSYGYTIDNVQWILKEIQYMKWDIPQEYFIKLCKIVTDKINDTYSLPQK